MSEYGKSAPAAAAHRGSVSVPFVLAASILIGIGIFTISYALTIFDGWYLMVGIAPLLVGALLLFSPRAGLDRA
jgi:hypothetical protein